MKFDVFKVCRHNQMGNQKHFVLGNHGRKRKEHIYKSTKYEFPCNMRYPLYNHFRKNLLFLWENTSMFYKRTDKKKQKVSPKATKTEFALRKAKDGVKWSCKLLVKLQVELFHRHFPGNFASFFNCYSSEHLSRSFNFF